MNEENKMEQIVTEMMEHLCENLCMHPRRLILSQEELDVICVECRMGQYVDDILNEYNELNDFDRSQSAALLKKYQGFVRCADCEYQSCGKLTGIHWCRLSNGLDGELGHRDGCARGKTRERI